MVWLHDLNPFAIQFTETFGVRWYGLAYLAGFLAGYLTIHYLSKRGRTLLKADELTDYVTYVAVGVLAGGRVGYCLFYQPHLLFEFDGSFPFWGVFKVNEGGMASHGGILGVLVAAWIYSWKHKVSWFHLMDVTVFGGALGFFFGRLANFVNGELFGRAAPEGYWWAVQFPQEMYLWASREVNKLYALGDSAAALGKLPSGQEINGDLWHGWVMRFHSDSEARRLVYDTLDSLIIAVQSGVEPVKLALAQVLTARYPSQLYQAVLEGLLVFLILFVFWLKPRKPGVVAGMFGLLYSLARIAGEQFRMPDAHIGFQWLGLTRGQWLSVVLVLIALVYLYFVSRRKVPKIGGL